MSPSLRPAHVRLPQAKLTRIETLHAAPRNHSKKQLRQLAASITTFGFTNPVLVDASGEVIAGHGRLAAARMLGLCEVPTLCVDWLNAAG
jgi:ParB-like chromosome segregation protein Spo0J